MCFVCFGPSSFSKKSSFLHDNTNPIGEVVYLVIGLGPSGDYFNPLAGMSLSMPGVVGAGVNVGEWMGGAPAFSRANAVNIDEVTFNGRSPTSVATAVNIDEWATAIAVNVDEWSAATAVNVDELPAFSFVSIGVDEATGGSTGATAPVTDGNFIVSEGATLAGSTGQNPGAGGDTIAGTTTTTATIAISQAVTGYANTATDSDWFRITLTAGQTYTFAGFGFGQGSLANPEITIYDATGAQVAYDDNSGPLNYARLSYTATTSGTYYIGASGTGPATGQYMVTANAGTSVYYPTLTVAQISDQLTHTYWESNGGIAVKWNTSNVTFNASDLEPERAILARAAFAAWSDVCGLNFTEVTTGGNIVLDDEDSSGAYANYFYSGGFITSATINVAKNWFGGDDSIDSYTYQTYLHEIGHTLGFGHGGPYNGSASWNTDNSYANDIWQYTLMSYFDGTDPNPDLASYRFTMTPMMADIYAAQSYYGARTSRSTDTVYGHNSNAGSTYSFSSYSQAPSFTVYDSGGTDAIDASGYSSTQTIDLNAGAFSSIGGLSRNIGIAIGTLVENAKGGSGVDTIIGNTANNVLEGGSGADSMAGEVGNDTLRGGTGNDRLWGNDGDDQIAGEGNDDNIWGGSGNDRLWGNAGADAIDGQDGDDNIWGGAENDRIWGGSGSDAIDGQDGDDTIDGGTGNDQIWGGAGVDTIGGGVGVDLLSGGAGNDTILGGDQNDQIWGDADSDQLAGDNGEDVVSGGEGNDKMWGNAGADHLYGGSGSDNIWGGTQNDILWGDADNDFLDGQDGNDILEGGGGNDNLWGGTGIDTFIFRAGWGVDHIHDFQKGVDKLTFALPNPVSGDQIGYVAWNGSYTLFYFAGQQVYVHADVDRSDIYI